VRFCVISGSQRKRAYELVLSHAEQLLASNSRAFRGSIGIETSEGYAEVHVGMQSGKPFLGFTPTSPRGEQFAEVEPGLSGA